MSLIPSVARGSLALLLLFCSSCGSASTPAARQLLTWQGATMGTTYTVKVVAAAFPEADRARIPEAIESQLNRVNELMSTYLPSSELSRFNQSDGAAPFPLSPETLEVFQVASRVGRLSGGAFDVTVGPLVNAWGFGPPGKPAQPPPDSELQKLKANVGWDKIILDEPQASLRKTAPGVYCDLSAVAKGYAVDRVSETLVSLGYEEHMVEVGGEVRTRGRNGEGQPWRIGVEKPLENGRGVQRAVPLENMAMATSGDYRNYYEIEGRRISHEIDPRTARPIAHHLASVAVVAETCAEADALATALIVLGEDEGYKLAAGQNLAALFFVREGDGFAEKASPRFEELFPGDESFPVPSERRAKEKAASQ